MDTPHEFRDGVRIAALDDGAGPHRHDVSAIHHDRVRPGVVAGVTGFVPGIDAGDVAVDAIRLDIQGGDSPKLTGHGG